MTSGLMSAGNNFPNQAGVSVRHPANDEKRGLNVMFIEEVEKYSCASLDTRGEVLPVFSRHSIGERLNLEVILHVHGHHVLPRLLAHSNAEHSRQIVLSAPSCQTRGCYGVTLFLIDTEPVSQVTAAAGGRTAWPAQSMFSPG